MVMKKDAKAETDELLKRLDKQVDEYFESEEDIKEFLNFTGQFTNYSTRNKILLSMQMKGARFAATYKNFQKMGIQVRAGEKGMRLLKPITAKVYQDEQSNWHFVSTASPAIKRRVERGEIKTEYRPTSYRAFSVFDISQTLVPPEDIPKMMPNKWLDGNYPAIEFVNEGIKNVMEKHEIELKAGWSDKYLGVARGAFDPSRNEIVLNPRNTDLENGTTLIHEVAHGLLHKETSLSHAEQEFQAEMTTYAVCSAYGIDTSEQSFTILEPFFRRNKGPCEASG